MNPVDHVRCPESTLVNVRLTTFSSLTVVVIINISVKLQLSRGTQRRVKRRVSSQLGELGCYVVHRRRKIKTLHGASEQRDTFVILPQHLKVVLWLLSVSNLNIQTPNDLPALRRNRSLPLLLKDLCFEKAPHRDLLDSQV